MWRETEAREKERGTTCGRNPRDGKGGGQKASSAAPGLSHRRVPGQCEGADTQSYLPLLSWATDSRRAWSSDAAAVILGVSLWISLSSSHMRVSTSRRFLALEEWRLGDGDNQRRFREGRGEVGEGERRPWRTSIRCKTTLGTVIGRDTVCAGGERRGLESFLYPGGGGQGPRVIVRGRGNPCCNRS